MAVVPDGSERIQQVPGARLGSFSRCPEREEGHGPQAVPLFPRRIAQRLTGMSTRLMVWMTPLLARTLMGFTRRGLAMSGSLSIRTVVPGT